MKDLKSLTLEELKEELKEGGFPAYRAGQLYRWLHVQLAEDPEEMTNLPAKLKQFLSENYTMTRLQVADWTERRSFCFSCRTVKPSRVFL